MKERTYIISKQQQYVQSVDLKAGRYTINYSIRTPNTSHRFAFLKKSGGWQEFEMQNLTPWKWHRKDEAKMSFYLLEDVVAFNLCTSPVSVSSPVMIQKLMLEEGMNASTAKPNELDLIESIEDVFDMEHIFKPVATLQDVADAEAPESLQQDDYIPDGWFDDPISATPSNPFVIHTFRQRIGYNWGAFVKPVLYSNYATPGTEGHSPEIRSGYWWVYDPEAGDYVNTGIKAEGEKGDDGITINLRTEVLVANGVYTGTSVDVEARAGSQYLLAVDTLNDFNNNNNVFRIEIAARNGVTGGSISGKTLTNITAITGANDSGTITLSISIKTTKVIGTFTRTINYKMVKSGEAVVWKLQPSATVIKKTGSSYTPSSVNCTVLRIDNEGAQSVSPLPANIKLYHRLNGGIAGLIEPGYPIPSSSISSKLQYLLYDDESGSSVLIDIVDITIGGEDGHSPYIGANGNWWVWDANQNKYIDSGDPAHGDDGHSPYIDETTGTWWVWEDGSWTDTEIKAKGDDGAGINTVTTVYILSDNGNTPPASGAAWLGTQPTPVQGKYLWTKTTTTYTDGRTPTIAYSVSYFALDGETPEFGYQVTLNNSAPPKPVGNLPHNGWTTAQPSISKTYPYLWIVQRTGSGSVVWSEPALHAVWMQGDNGLPGKSPIVKDWVVGDKHYNDELVNSILYVRGTSFSTSHFYRLVTETDSNGITALAAPVDGVPTHTDANGNEYKLIGYLDYQAVRVFIAEEANMANLIFKEGVLFSQKGRTLAGVEVNYGSPVQYAFNTSTAASAPSTGWTDLPGASVGWYRFREPGGSWTNRRVGSASGRWQVEFSETSSGTWYTAFSGTRYWMHVRQYGASEWNTPEKISGIGGYDFEPYVVIDGNGGKINFTTEAFTIKDKDGNNIAVFTQDENGKPVLKAENIDVDNLTVKKLITPFLVTESANTTQFQADLISGHNISWAGTGSPNMTWTDLNLPSDLSLDGLQVNMFSPEGTMGRYKVKNSAGQIWHNNELLSEIMLAPGVSDRITMIAQKSPSGNYLDWTILSWQSAMLVSGVYYPTYFNAGDVIASGTMTSGGVITVQKNKWAAGYTATSKNFRLNRVVNYDNYYGYAIDYLNKMTIIVHTPTYQSYLATVGVAFTSGENGHIDFNFSGISTAINFTIIATDRIWQHTNLGGL